jgi:hypothetical protein
VPQQQQRQPDAREHDEQHGGEQEDGYAEQTGEQQELLADDSTTAQDARDVDGQTGPITRALSVVALDLASQVAENECAGRDDEEADEAQA